jgi:hypothetical protein
VERSEIEETSEYDLEGLFIMPGYAIDSIGARRVVLETIENLFSGFLFGMAKDFNEKPEKEFPDLFLI